MMKNPNDIGFIHDIGSLDKLRQQAVSGKEGDDDAALKAAALGNNVRCGWPLSRRVFSVR